MFSGDRERGRGREEAAVLVVGFNVTTWTWHELAGGAGVGR
jgi:hypothetical protein